MDKVNKMKICPNCGVYNSPGNLECEQCEQDLMGVPLTDSTTAAPSPAPAANPVQPAANVRICPECKEENPAAMRKCRKCGEDISDVLPVYAEACSQGTAAFLETDDGFSFPVTQGTVVIGREAQMREYLGDHAFVSRNHAEISLHDGVLWVHDLGSTNHTYVNGEQIHSEPHKLAENDLLSLGGALVNGIKQPQAAYFTVRYR